MRSTDENAKVLDYAAPGAKKSTLWLVILCLATAHLCLLIPLGLWFGYLTVATALLEIDWRALTWLQRVTFAPWYMHLPEMLSVVAGVVTWTCIWSEWRQRPTRLRLLVAIALQALVAVFFLAVGPYLEKVGWLPLQHSAQARGLSEEIPGKLIGQGFVAFPMLAFGLRAFRAKGVD